jgi:oligosaccharide repeat unit polymerase
MMTREPAPAIWWLHPVSFFSCAGVSIGLFAYLTPESAYRTLWRTPKFFDLYALGITLACVAVFAFGAVMSSNYASNSARREAANGRDKIPWGVMMTLFRMTFYLSVLGYAIWAGLAIQRGMTLSDVIGIATGEKGAMYDARYTFLPTVGGVTTFAEFGSATVILGAILGFCRGWQPVRWKLGVLLFLAIGRALINSERFAIIELVVPFAVASLAFLNLKQGGAIKRSLINLAPVIGIAGLLTVFTTFEYFRSWSNYYQGRNLNLVEFGSSRLLGYYVTSFNNGAYFLQRLDPLEAPYFTFHFLWSLPPTVPLVHRLFPNPLLDTNDKWFYFPFLDQDANLEFNNADGMMFPLMDYGVPGGLIYWFVVGVGCGLLYRWYRRREPLGLLLYPLVCLGLMEVPLALYWSEGRAFPAQCLLIGTPVLFWIHRRQVPAHKASLSAAKFSVRA